MNNSIINSTIKDNLCIGCGICAVACPVKAIEMKISSEKIYKPEIIKDLCINCGKCTKYCPNTFEKIMSESQTVSEQDAMMFGLNASKFYTGYVRNENERKYSASGGIVTYIAQQLFKKEKISAVIHAESVYARTGELHYQACLSTSIDELNSRRGSIYAAISFEKAINEIEKNRYSGILVIGTPCIIRGVKQYLQAEQSRYKFIKRVYTIALSCSHNVNGLFTDYLADSLHVDKGSKYVANMRDKEDICDANNFNIHYESKTEVLAHENRYKCEFTKQWRSYSFSMNVCNACSDFWGYEADLSVKDAWGKWSKDPMGTSILVVRTEEMDSLLNEASDIVLEKENLEIIKMSQVETVIFKQGNAVKRLKAVNAEQFNKISFIHRLNNFMRIYSEREYERMINNGYNKKINRMAEIISLIRKIAIKGEKYVINNKIFKRKERQART